jgi:hypothetical protein
LIDAKPEGVAPVLSHVATDGESYGHHHQNGDMALAYCLETIDKGHEAELTLYGEFLEKNPPVYEARIVENSSWSCAHGVERWRSDCGCSAGTPGFHQKWRAPLREALDWLRERLAAQFQRESAQYLKDPWEARDDYIDVILDRSRESVERWLVGHASRPLMDQEKVRVLKLMESQRSALLMYTSCGWFFDDISSLETVQILRYAARAADLIHELTDLDFELKFVRLLEKAPSNVQEYKNGRIVYELLAKPARISFERLAAHYGIVALFSDFPEKISEGCWDMTGKFAARVTESPVPNSRAFAAGEVEVTSNITWEKKEFMFAVNYRGDTSVACGVVPAETGKKLLEDTEVLRDAFTSKSDEKKTASFGRDFFSLRHILHDTQKSLLDKLLRRDIGSIEKSLHEIVQDYDRLLEYLTDLDINAPAVIRSAAGIVLTADMIHGLEAEIPDVENLRRHVGRARQWNVALDDEQIGFALTDWLVRQMLQIHHSPTNSAEMERICAVLTPFLDEFKWRVSLYEAQNLYHSTQSKFHQQLAQSSPQTRAAFRKLGERLRFAEEALN